MIFAMFAVKRNQMEQLICMTSRAPPHVGKPMPRLFQWLQHGRVPNG